MGYLAIIRELEKELSGEGKVSSETGRVRSEVDTHCEKSELSEKSPVQSVDFGEQPSFIPQPKARQFPRQGQTGPCRYDWQPGYPGLRLRCVSHPHAAGTATVFRMLSCGHDVLLEMKELGILTGQALTDAQRVQ